ncbi:MAG: nuclear transport factor 2 family protein [Candidatus Nanoarchaeia archaeon]|nr:nuclear transport factor 2 family protein [Candidatus Nanoarchaeia archaeon]
MINQKTARQILKIYEEAWTKQDTKKILSIFTKDAIYHERVLEKPINNHKGIGKYWDKKVVREQSKIRFRLLKFYTIKNTIIAEWEAWFYDKIKKENKHIREIAILEIKYDKIKSLREYWASETI